jgi:hypothetical protein
MNYYYSPDGQSVLGPYPLDHLLKGLRNGSLPSSTQICEEGTEEWKLLSGVSLPKIHVATHQPTIEQPKKQKSTKHSSLTKHADWQPLPKAVSEALPCCPLCLKRGEWEVYDKWAMTTRGYLITCGHCDAEWEYTISKAKDFLWGGALLAINRLVNITQDDSLWILRELGSSDRQKYHQLLDIEIAFSKWKRMVKSFCGTCGSPLARDEKYCPNCGKHKL